MADLAIKMKDWCPKYIIPEEMKLRHLETLLMVARRGGLSQAADALDMAPSTVALHLAELERDLGVKLIERAGRGVRLTGAGRQLSPHAESVLSAAQRMRSAAGDLRDGGSGRIAVGAVEPAASHRLPAVLAAFCERLPAVSVA